MAFKRSRKLFVLLFCLFLVGFSMGYTDGFSQQIDREGNDTKYIPRSLGEIVYHSSYSLSYNEQHEQANWVYYSLNLKGVKKKGAVRSDDFREDVAVHSGSAKPTDYAKSGYDRGHLCPAADMKKSRKAMSETFYMSNMSPQIPAFNRGVWKKLEERIRLWAEKELLYIVTGPVFKDNKGTIGSNQVTVPGYYYKVVYSPLRKQMIAFILPNEKGKYVLKAYVSSVDQVETLTDVDFFPQLPDTLENRLESKSSPEKWGI